MAIPVANIYYLLSYAWDKLDESDKVSIKLDDKTSLLDLFARILINSTKILLKRGLDNNYIYQIGEIAGIKGKLQISDTLKKQVLLIQRTICSHDEFTDNILQNQILRSTLYRLSRTSSLDKGLIYDLTILQKKLAHIDLVPLKNVLFRQVRITKNNKFYGFIMNVCHIVYENTLPSEQSGIFKFIDFTRDENKMNRLFEAFIRNFYKKEQSNFSIVKKEIINWQFSSNNETDFSYLPTMQTDITLENENSKIIIDAKYYKETMNSYYNNKRIHSSNLYQLFSYLLNQRSENIKTKNTTGILIYPTIEEEYNISFKHMGHNIFIRTLNLNRHWTEISDRLKDIISF